MRGSHYWARELRALGHEVALIPPQYVKPYVDRGKNDAADAEAICEAMSRPKVEKRFVAVKTVEQQARQMLIGVRESLLKRRTQVSNTIRGYGAEFGLVAPKGLGHLEPLIEQIEGGRDASRTRAGDVCDAGRTISPCFGADQGDRGQADGASPVEPAQPQAGRCAGDRSGDCGDAHRQGRRSQGRSARAAISPPGSD